MSRRAPRRFTVTAPLVVIVCLVFFWWAITAFSGIQAWRLPSPYAVLARGYSLVQQPSLWLAFARTGVEALVGGFIGVCVALPLSYFIFRFRTIAEAIEPLLGTSQALPAVALAPFLVLWFGYGLIPISMLCALIAFFPILISSLVGLRSLDRQVCEAAQLDGAAGITMAVKIEIPLASPAILAGIRNGFTLCGCRRNGDGRKGARNAPFSDAHECRYCRNVCCDSSSVYTGSCHLHTHVRMGKALTRDG